MDEYKYNQINHQEPIIRLVKLISGLPAAEITCELFEIALGDIKEGLPYEALSYTWGSPQAYLEKENKNKKIICHPPDDTRQVI